MRDLLGNLGRSPHEPAVLTTAMRLAPVSRCLGSAHLIRFSLTTHLRQSVSDDASAMYSLPYLLPSMPRIACERRSTIGLEGGSRAPGIGRSCQPDVRIHVGMLPTTSVPSGLKSAQHDHRGMRADAVKRPPCP